MLNNQNYLMNQAVIAWENLMQDGKSNSWQGWDPYDALESPMIRNVTSVNHWTALLAVQFLRTSPLNLRRLFRVHKCLDPKALMLFALALLLRWRQTRNEHYLSTAEKVLERIAKHKAPVINNFAVAQSREIQMLHYRSHVGSPNQFLTLLAGKTFLKASELVQNEKYKEISLSIGDYFIDEAPKTWFNNKLFFHYNSDIGVVNRSDVRVFNVSALIGAFLLQLWQRFQKDIYFELGKAAIEYILNHQESDGFWKYSDRAKYVDTFHLIFIIWALLDSEQALENEELSERINRAVDYLESRLLDSTNDGICPKRFDHKFPIPTAQRITVVDLRDIALTILLFSRLAKRNKTQKENYLYVASETLRWAMKNFYNDKNFFYEKTKFWMNRIPYISLQGWMVYALSEYFDAIESSNNSF